jgi:hypothetical protein
MSLVGFAYIIYLLAVLCVDLLTVGIIGICAATWVDSRPESSE